MKRIRSLWILVMICLIGMMLAACGTKEPAFDVFEGAVIAKSFPVPKEANAPDSTTTNSAMDYVRYSLAGLKEKEGVPQAYLEAIKAWGWEEQTDEGADSSRVFQKDGITVHLTVHDDYFIVMIPKEQKTAIKGLKTK
ncbi:hypothetical protein [Paenibacillus tengchongensis]|uniref:hypothetical protein n=1 Tax=Paenibacillus tengchongensis TaxID=2608684 RepID=UPI00124DF9DE|nr:hypothetical protein [Paenibacillus tengchongensis]